ncbi:MAG: winged helix-turn-helix domain-containing protein [Rhodocyclaceae bacterium]|nr:winged helix-turn-helix domain-containing protein [Rhodocyclaceae bacterium]MBK6554453.1 winged helix-turn-helix domain-containing protein [Rhodocyclaceae bacterium]
MTKRHLAKFDLAEFRVDPACRTIAGPRGASCVEPRVMDVLIALALRAPKPMSREDLIDQVWGSAFVTDGVLTRCISILRERFGDERGRPRVIETLAKHGYRLMPTVTFIEDEALAPVPATASAPMDAHRTITVAVLPFVDLRGHAADDHLADGLTELLIANLAGIASLRVVARTSSMAYKGTGKRVREIAGELGVDYVIEGSLLGAGTRVQVVAQLIEGGSEMHAWTQTWTRAMRDALTLLNEVARAVANALSARLRPAENLRLARRIAIDETALRHYLKGRYFWAQRGPDPLGKAIAEFAACARAAPDFAPAHVGLADSQILLAMYGFAAPLTVADRARAHVADTLALDPDSAEALTADGAIRLFFDWDFEPAERSFSRALALNPSYTTAYLAYGDLLMMRAEFDRGLGMMRDAVALSPLDLGLNMNLGDFLIFARRFDEAARHLEHTLEIAPGFVPGRLRLAEALALAGRHDMALAQAEIAFAEAPSLPRARETRALVFAIAGRRDEARQELAVLAAARRERYVSAWEIARAYAVMADADAAIEWLSEAIAERAPMTLFAGIHATLDPVRDDGRFPTILRGIGLPLAR